MPSYYSEHPTISYLPPTSCQLPFLPTNSSPSLISFVLFCDPLSLMRASCVTIGLEVDTGAYQTQQGYPTQDSESYPRVSVANGSAGKYMCPSCPSLSYDWLVTGPGLSWSAQVTGMMSSGLQMAMPSPEGDISQPGSPSSSSYFHPPSSSMLLSGLQREWCQWLGQGWARSCHLFSIPGEGESLCPAVHCAEKLRWLRLGVAALCG